jgi:hypothetical protein
VNVTTSPLSAASYVMIDLERFGWISLIPGL